MRTSHTNIKRRILDVKSKLTDKQIFGSHAFGAYLTDIAEASAKRYKRKLTVKMIWDDSENANIAYTNNRSIVINGANYLTSSFPGRKLKADSLMGLNGHELGHVLYTNFTAHMNYINALLAGRFYPTLPDGLSDEENEWAEEIVENLKNDEVAKGVILKVAGNITNILEDVYVEARICNDFPGRFATGIRLNNLRFSEYVPTIKTQIDKGDYKFAIAANLIIQYCKSGDINNVDDYKGEYLEFIAECIPLVDESVYDDDMRSRFSASNHIMIKAWEYIKELIEKAREADKENKASGGSKTLEEILSELLGELAGQIAQMSEDPTGTTKGATAKGKFAPSPDAEDAAMEELKQVIAEESARISLVKTESFSEGDDGSIKKNNSYLGSGYEGADKDMERIMNNVASEITYEQMENELSEELQSEAGRINYGNAHRGIKMVINRMSYVNPAYKTMYQTVSSPLLTLSKRMQKQVMQVLKDNRAGGKQTNLLMGRRLNARSFVRDDGKVFYNNRLPQDSAELAVALLVDESGSMHSCDRITSARGAAIVVYDFCKKLGIPVMISGHSTAHKTVEMYSYAEFDSVDGNDMYRLMDMTARSGNRDGAALRYVSEKLSKRSEKTKLLILISDGQPADDNYYGTAAEADLRGIKQEYKNKGITMFAAAIGNDKDNIERIYGDGFLDITELNMLPTNLTKLIARYVKF